MPLHVLHALHYVNKNIGQWSSSIPILCTLRKTFVLKYGVHYIFKVFHIEINHFTIHIQT